MDKELLLKALNDVDGKYIRRADIFFEEKKKNRRPGARAALSWAAGALVLAVAVGAMFFTGALQRRMETELPALESSSAMETAPEEGPVTICYVEGREIREKTATLQLAPQPVFAAWREANAIGEEVRLVSCRLNSDGWEEKKTVSGVEVGVYHVGTEFSLEVVVSRELRDYYGAKDENLLLESLRQTLCGYSEPKISRYGFSIEGEEEKMSVVTDRADPADAREDLDPAGESDVIVGNRPFPQEEPSAGESTSSAAQDPPFDEESVSSEAESCDPQGEAPVSWNGDAGEDAPDSESEDFLCNYPPAPSEAESFDPAGG